MEDSQQRKRKTSFLRKLFNKITNKPIEPEDNDENEEDFEVIENEVNHEQGEEVIEGEENGENLPNVNVGNELAQELRAAFELYSKVRAREKSLERCTHSKLCCLLSKVSFDLLDLQKKIPKKFMKIYNTKVCRQRLLFTASSGL